VNWCPSALTDQKLSGSYIQERLPVFLPDVVSGLCLARFNGLGYDDLPFDEWFRTFRTNVVSLSSTARKISSGTPWLSKATGPPKFETSATTHPKTEDPNFIIPPPPTCGLTSEYYVKNFKHQRMHKEFFPSVITHSYMFRPCWVIFREKPSVVVTLGCTIQLSENVLFTVHCTVNSVGV
jgi:hypothetical protein